MKPLLLTAFLFLPATLGAQAYNESPFAPAYDAKNAVPLTQREDFKIHVKRALGTEALFFDTFSAGLDQWRNAPSAWGHGADGYAKRFGSQAGTKGVREMVGFGLDAALHTDPRVYRSTKTGFKGRLIDALSQVVVARTESGGHTFAVANVGSAFAAGQVQTLWMPAGHSNVSDGLVNAGLLLMADGARDVLREFWPDIHRKLHHGD